MQITDLYLVYISYDEPRAEDFYERLRLISPREPLRVHGIKGFDAAHKRAANLAQTDHFITIDGDNIVRPPFFRWALNLSEYPADVVFSYTAWNTVNGLAYGNGGVKIWPRQLLLTVDTHERANGNDFCWTFRYWQMNDIASDVHFAQSPYVAFRAGYREAVKLSLVRNQKFDWPMTRDKIYPPNYARILVWATVGADVTHGDWAIYGARCGLAHLWLDQLDANLIRDYDWFETRWKKVAQSDPRTASAYLGLQLERKLKIDLPMLSAKQSRWFKAVHLNPPRHGLMVPDMAPPK